MRQQYLPVLIIIVIFLCNACNKKIINPGSWQKTELKIDGSPDDWTDSFLYDTKNHLVYSVSNDNNNLYLCIKFLEDKDQFKILRNGFTVWFDTTGKGKKSYGIKYPIGGHSMNHQTEEKTFIPQNRDHNIKKVKNRIIKGQNEFEIIGFSLMGLEKNEKVTSNLFTCNSVKIALGMDSNEIMIYELSVPLKYLFKYPATRLKDTTRILSIGFEGSESNNNMGNHHRGMDDEDGEKSQEGNMRGGGMHDRMNPGMAGGMEGGGEPPGNMGGDETKLIKKWIKVKLASH